VSFWEAIKLTMLMMNTLGLIFPLRFSVCSEAVPGRAVVPEQTRDKPMVAWRKNRIFAI
jgi:hypothetical protein